MKLSNVTLNESPDITNIYSPKILSDSLSMIILHKLNPLAKTFIWRCDDDTDLHKKRSMVNTNAIGQNDELSIITFMAFILIVTSYIVNEIADNTFLTMSSNVGSNINPEDATSILSKIRINNVNKVIIGTLNINSSPPKFEQLKLIISNYIDVFVIQETKLDPSFRDDQFVISGYTKPYRLDRIDRVGAF